MSPSLHFHFSRKKSQSISKIGNSWIPEVSVSENCSFNLINHWRFMLKLSKKNLIIFQPQWCFDRNCVFSCRIKWSSFIFFIEPWITMKIILKINVNESECCIPATKDSFSQTDYFCQQDKVMPFPESKNWTPNQASQVPSARHIRLVKLHPIKMARQLTSMRGGKIL